MLAACCVFFGDVFVRRVQVSLAWVPPLAGRARDWILRRSRRRPRSRKPWIACGAARRRWPGSSNSFARPRVSGPAGGRAGRPGRLAGAGRAAAGRPGARRDAADAEQKPEEESYTERLLQAKKKVWKQTRNRGPSPLSRQNQRHLLGWQLHATPVPTVQLAQRIPSRNHNRHRHIQRICT